jgi:hypothetical protein
LDNTLCEVNKSDNICTGPSHSKHEYVGKLHFLLYYGLSLTSAGQVDVLTDKTRAPKESQEESTLISDKRMVRIVITRKVGRLPEIQANFNLCM